MLETAQPQRTLYLHWGDRAIAITRLAAIPEGLSKEHPVMLADGESAVLQEPFCSSSGRTLEEYACDPSYWATQEEIATSAANGIDPVRNSEYLSARSPWASDLLAELFVAIDNGAIDAARSLLAEAQSRIDPNDGEILKAAILLKRREVLLKKEKPKERS